MEPSAAHTHQRVGGDGGHAAANGARHAFDNGVRWHSVEMGQGCVGGGAKLFSKYGMLTKPKPKDAMPPNLRRPIPIY